VRQDDGAILNHPSARLATLVSLPQQAEPLLSRFWAPVKVLPRNG
jgi:hypothetical protein